MGLVLLFNKQCCTQQTLITHSLKHFMNTLYTWQAQSEFQIQALKVTDDSHGSQDAQGKQTRRIQLINTLRQAVLEAKGEHITQVWNIREGFLEVMAPNQSLGQAKRRTEGRIYAYKLHGTVSLYSHDISCLFLGNKVFQATFCCTPWFLKEKHSKHLVNLGFDG